jgi:hypothetical protein
MRRADTQLKVAAETDLTPFVAQFCRPISALGSL